MIRVQDRIGSDAATTCAVAAVISKVLGHTDEGFTRRVYIHTRDAPHFDDLDDTFTIEASE